MFCEIRTIGPEEAARLLETNTGNRSLRNRHVAFFEGQLERGEMQLTHQGIAISESGRLLDGQHRLTAIVNTGISAQMLVASGLPDTTFEVLDTGTARTAADVLSIEQVPNAAAAAAAIRLYLLWAKMPQVTWSGAVTSTVGTTTSVSETFRADPDNWVWAAKLGQSHSLPGVIVPSVLAVLGYMATVKSGFSREYFEEFAMQLRDGADLSPGSPILAYRNKAFGVGVTRRQQGRLADYVKMFNCYAREQSLRIFKAQSVPPMPALVTVAQVMGAGR